MKYHTHCGMIHETKYGLSLSAYQSLKETRIIQKMPHNFRGLGLWSVSSIAFEAVVKQNLLVGSGWEASWSVLGWLGLWEEGEEKGRGKEERWLLRGTPTRTSLPLLILPPQRSTLSQHCHRLMTKPSTHSLWEALKTQTLILLTELCSINHWA